jgi:predicted O-methyltransferase YrrM
MPTPTFEFVAKHYEKFADAVRLAKKEQRAIRENDPSMKAQLDDLESEITYLLLREYQPETVVEIGCLHGWSTSWILRALRDNGKGTLYSYDIVEHATRHVPAELSAGRWHFVPGDVRNRLSELPYDIDYLFIDAAHSGRFAKWYIADLLPRLRPGTPVSVHDVFHGARPLPFTEGAVLLDWLRRTERPYFTVSPAHARPVHDRVLRLREELGLTERVHTGKDNPMLYFAY